MLVLVSIIDYEHDYEPEHEREHENLFERVTSPANLSELGLHSILRHVERISHALAWHFRDSTCNNYLRIGR